MMSDRLFKLLPILLAFFVICSVSAFAVVADESEAVSAETSVEESADASADESATTSDESATTSDESGETSGTTSATTSGTTSDTTSHDHDHSGDSSDAKEESNIPWQLIITLGVIVIVVAVLFILTKTNTKAGLAIAKFFKDYKSELKKVVWMPRKDLLKSTGIVLLVLVCACIVIGLLDLGFSSLLNLLSSIG